MKEMEEFLKDVTTHIEAIEVEMSIFKVRIEAHIEAEVTKRLEEALAIRKKE